MIIISIVKCSFEYCGVFVVVGISRKVLKGIAGFLN